MRRRSLFALVIVLAAATLLVSCGDDDSDSATRGEPAATSVARPTGAPIVVSVISGNRSPEVFHGAKAAADAINAAGGVKVAAGGPARPVRILTCEADPARDPNAPTRCAREAVGAGAVAVAGKLVSSDEMVTIIAGAGIPLVGSFATVPEDFKNALSFPFSAGSAGAAAGLGVLLQEQGAKKIGLVVTDSQAAPTIEKAIAALLRNGQSDVGVSLRVPVDPTADRAPLMAQIVEAKVDGVAVVDSATLLGLDIRALRDAGYSGKVVVVSPTLTSEVIKDLGDQVEGVFGVSNLPAASTNHAKLAQFRKEMGAYAPKDTFRNEFSLNAWLAVHVVADTLAKVTTIDARSLAASLNGLQISDAGGLPPFTLGTAGIKFLPFPRVPRATVQFQVVRNGEFVPLGRGFVDLNAHFKG